MGLAEDRQTGFHVSRLLDETKKIGGSRQGQRPVQTAPGTTAVLRGTKVVDHVPVRILPQTSMTGSELGNCGSGRAVIKRPNFEPVGFR